MPRKPAMRLNGNSKRSKNISRSNVTRDVAMALLMAVGLSTVFLTPFRFSKVATIDTPIEQKSGRILGESIVMPLSIPVTVLLSPEQRWETTVSPKTGMIAEALGQVAGRFDRSFTYNSRGDAAFLQSFFTVMNDATGSWSLRLNGLLLTDMNTQYLEQGDELTLTWTSL